MKVDNSAKNDISNASALFANLAPDLHSTRLLVAWMKPRSGSARPFSPSLLGRKRLTERNSRMTRFIDLTERLSTRAQAQDRVVWVVLSEQRCNPFTGHGEVRGDGHSDACRLWSAKHKQR